MRTDILNGNTNHVDAACRNDASAAPADAKAATADKMTAPLQWWRSLPPEAYSARDVEVLNAILARVAILRETLWPAAAAGDATAAMGVALRLSRNIEQPTDLVDLAMTALLPPALKGNPAAVLVLANLIRRMVPESLGEQLASAWLAYGDLPSDARGRALLSPVQDK